METRKNGTDGSFGRKKGEKTNCSSRSTSWDKVTHFMSNE